MKSYSIKRPWNCWLKRPTKISNAKEDPKTSITISYGWDFFFHFDSVEDIQVHCRIPKGHLIFPQNLLVILMYRVALNSFLSHTKTFSLYWIQWIIKAWLWVKNDLSAWLAMLVNLNQCDCLAYEHQTYWCMYLSNSSW